MESLQRLFVLDMIPVKEIRKIVDLFAEGLPYDYLVLLSSITNLPSDLILDPH